MAISGTSFDVSQWRIQLDLAIDFEVDPPLGDKTLELPKSGAPVPGPGVPSSGAALELLLSYLLETRPNKFAIGANSSGLAANQAPMMTTSATRNQTRPAHPSTSVPANI